MEVICGALEDVGQLIRVVRSLQVSVFGSLVACLPGRSSYS